MYPMKYWRVLILRDKFTETTLVPLFFTPKHLNNMATMTAEEFIREKIRTSKDIKGQMYALWKYDVNGEECLRWAYEFHNIQTSELQKEVSALKKLLRQTKSRSNNKSNRIERFVKKTSELQKEVEELRQQLQDFKDGYFSQLKPE